VECRLIAGSVHPAQTPEEIAAKLETSKRTRVRSRQLLDMYHNQFDPEPPASDDGAFGDDGGVRPRRGPAHLGSRAKEKDLTLGRMP
jgi:hypothetical protein